MHRMGARHRHRRVMLFGIRRQGAKQAMSLHLHARGKVDFVRVAIGAAVAGNQSPQVTYHDRPTIRAEQLAQEVIRLGIKDVDLAVAEISHKKIVGEFPETRGRDGKPPRRIKGPP